MKRDISLDVYKGTLVILMISAHIVQFYIFNEIAAIFSNYVNLTTFSGFMFSYGYVCYSAYIKKEIDERILRYRLFKNFVLIILAYFISGISFTFLASKDISFDVLIKICTFKIVPGYSEFLLSFALINPLVYFFKNEFKYIQKSGVILVVIISLLCTNIRYEIVTNNILGVLIGSYQFASFPILQYMSYFICGIYLSKYNKIFDGLIFTFAICGTLSFICFYYENISLPNRFPPSIYWVGGAGLFVYAYFLFYKSKIFTKHIINAKIVRFFAQIGENTLTYLVCSNILIFLSYYIVSSFGIALSGKLLYMFIIILFFLCLLFANVFVCLKNNLKLPRYLIQKKFDRHLNKIK